MAKTKTATKNKNTKASSAKTNAKKDSTKAYKGAIIALAVVSVGLIGGLIYAITQIPSYEEREYLDLYGYLMERYPEARCESMNQTRKIAILDENDESHQPALDNKWDEEYYACMTTGYGVSKDGDPYVSYSVIVTDPRTHEFIREEKDTVYFQHRHDGVNGYSEALGHDE